MAKWFPGRRLSWFRLTLLMVIVAGLVAGGFYVVGDWQDRKEASTEIPWADGYVDVTATPTYDFENLQREDSGNIVLAFVVASHHDACEPSWGGAYSLDQAGSQLNLDRRLARYRSLGGSAMVSFGGQANTALAFGCTDEMQLKRAYSAVVERYELSSIDIDVEGELLANRAAITRQANALAALQKERESVGGLDVWVTLPVAIDGLPTDAISVVRAYLHAGVRLAGVNAMTMNFNIESGTSMWSATQQSLVATQRQVRALYQEAGAPIGEATAWSRVSATVMIGQNDIAGEVFTLKDAERLNEFAADRGMVRLSMWSSNRDQQCTDTWPDPRSVSDSCSGVEQSKRAFAVTLAEGRKGSISQVAEALPSPDEQYEHIVDDPLASPYPVWGVDIAYPAGSHVVWRRNVYEAQWWNQGEQPDQPLQSGSAHPWRLLGPVLPGEKPYERPQLPADAFPQWEKANEYRRGDRVIFDGQGFEAKWWTQADSPDASLVQPEGSPWRPLSDEEIIKILNS